MVHHNSVLHSIVKMQAEYSRLVKKSVEFREPFRSNLTKSASATKTALESLNEEVLNVEALKALEEFEKLLKSVNDIFDMMIIVPPEPSKQVPVKLEIEEEVCALIDAEIKPEKQAEN